MGEPLLSTTGGDGGSVVLVTEGDTGGASLLTEEVEGREEEEVLT